MTLISSSDEQFNSFSRFLEGQVNEGVNRIEDYIRELMGIADSTKGATEYLAVAGEQGMSDALKDFKNLSNEVLTTIAATRKLTVSDIDETTQAAQSLNYNKI